MPNILKIPHALLAAYIQQYRIDPALLSRIKTIQDIDPAYELLFNLIREARLEPGPTASSCQLPDETEIFEPPFGILINLLSGNPHPFEQQFFLNLLANHIEFYDSLMKVLSRIAPGIYAGEIPELESGRLHIKSDAALLTEYVFCS